MQTEFSSVKSYMSYLADSAEALQSYAETFDGRHSVNWMLQHVEIPIFSAMLYACFITWGREYFERKGPVGPWIRHVNMVWNFLLAIFSTAGAVICAPALINAHRTKGLNWTLCASPRTPGYFYDGPIGLALLAFSVSKIPEMVDTVFLVVQGKKLIFLHWFHHLTVMLYCWHCWVTASASGIYFSTINYVVHSIMYSYYFFMCFKVCRPFVKKVAILITALQVLQMIVGIVISSYTLYLVGSTFESLGEVAPLMEPDTWGVDHPTLGLVEAIETTAGRTAHTCWIDPANAKIGFAMYVSYFILFVALFKKLYFPSKTRRGEESARTNGGATDKVDPRKKKSSGLTQ